MAFDKPSGRKLKVLRSAFRYFATRFEHEVVLRGKEVYGVSAELLEILEKLKVDCYAGVKLGEVGRRLRLTLEGTFWLLGNDRKKVWVNEKGEMLFLYGRDIFTSSVERCSEFGENEVVFVCNRFGDVLGIGKSRFSSEKLAEVDPDRVFVENLVDRGAYIRHERLYNAY
ncbi:MAG: PUA domain-containing protein [Archaeoglobaceae archaeon]